jgi:hypothetical protein
MHGPSGDNSKKRFAELGHRSLSRARATEGEDPIHCNARAEAIRQRRISTDEPEIFHRSDQAFPSGGDRTVMNDIDDDRDELAFAQLDLARYHSMLDLGHVRRQFETVLQDQHLLRCVGARFEVPGIARDGGV